MNKMKIVDLGYKIKNAKIEKSVLVDSLKSLQFILKWNIIP